MPGRWSMAKKSFNIDMGTMNTHFTEEELVLMAQSGDAYAEEFLIWKYKELVKNSAHLYFIAGADRDDIVQEGMIGIFKAIRDFDERRQASFRTFAEICVSSTGR